MPKLSDFLNYDLYPTLFSCLPTALPEFGFKRGNKGYQSTTDLKITGEHGAKGKVYVYENNISRLIDYTRESISIFDYIRRRDHLDNAQTLAKLSQLSGIALPHFDGEYKQTNTYEQIRRDSQIWEDAHQYFIYLLNDAPHAGHQRDDLRQYLTQRGYSLSDIVAMQLGFIPSFEKLFVYLTQTKKHAPNDVRDCIELHNNIGNTHCLAIPFRDAVGHIRGIIARNTNDTDNALLPKYLYSTGLKKQDTLFNIKAVKGQKHLLIVEGLLDALHAESKGIDNVVALGGTGFNTKQLQQAIKYGAVSLTFCLDNDTAGTRATRKALQTTMEHAPIKAYIAQLPLTVKDPDECLKILGLNALRHAIDNALPAYQYQLNYILSKYHYIDSSSNNTSNIGNANTISNTGNLSNLSNTKNDSPEIDNTDNTSNTGKSGNMSNIDTIGNTDNLSNLSNTKNDAQKTNNTDNTSNTENLSNTSNLDNTDNENTDKIDQTGQQGRVGAHLQLLPQQEDAFLNEVSQLAAGTKDPLDRDRLIARLLKLVAPWGISEQSIQSTIERLKSDKEKTTQAAAVQQLLNQAQQLKISNNTEQALQWLHSQSKKLLLQSKTSIFEHLTLPISEEQLQQRLISKIPGLSTGYTIAGEEILLPPGALSILCAPTSHGKTTFLLNILLNIVQQYPDKQIHFFSYEEDSDALILNALNTFINKELSKNNRTAINNYFTQPSEQHFERTSIDLFNAAKERFFQQLIASQRMCIHYIDYDSDTLIDAIRHLKNNTPVGAILIDYMQLLHKKRDDGRQRFNNRQEELKEICLNLKDMVIETGLPVLLGAQFNREVINPALIHPTKIGEAGDIERIAHLILGFWNNNFDAIGNDVQLTELKNNGFLKPNTLYVKLLKNRGGIANIADLLSYNGNTGKIDKMKKAIL